MTDSPVAAANARTMWKREITPIAAIPSRVNSSARWLSINQSAFWAGYMDSSLDSKRRHHDRFARVSFDTPCSGQRLAKLETGRERGRQKWNPVLPDKRLRLSRDRARGAQERALQDDADRSYRRLISRHPSPPAHHPWPALRRSSSDPQALSSAPPAARRRASADRQACFSNPRSAGWRRRASADGRRRVL